MNYLQSQETKSGFSGLRILVCESLPLLQTISQTRMSVPLNINTSASFVKSVVFMVLCVLYSVNTLFAQSDTTRINFDDLAAVQDADKPLYVRYGGYAHYDVAAWNRAQFVGFQGMKTCCFENYGDSLSLFGANFSIGALFEYPLFSRFGASLRVGYSQNSTLLRRIQATITPYAGVPIGTPIDYRLTANLSTLGVEPLLTIRPIDYLAINIGARLDVAMSSSYHYKEVIISDNVSFLGPNGEATSVWNEQQGAIVGRQTLTTSLVAGLSYEAPLNATGTLFLCPELWYSYGLTSLASVMVSRSNGTTVTPAWTQDRLRIGLAFKASPFRTIRPEVTPEMQDKIRQLRRIDSLNAVERERNKLQLAKMDSLNRVITARMEEMKKQGIAVNLTKLVGVNTSGEEVPNPNVVVEEVRGEQVITLLPSIFFDNGSSVIPTRYHRLQSAERGAFQVGNLAGRTALEVYREVLNIIGKRLTDNAGAVVFLKPQLASNEPPKVAETRAQAISDYLQDVWKIPVRRIVIEKNSAEKLVNSSNIPSVELAASMPEILAPVRFADLRTRRAKPSLLRFGVEINAGAGLKQWSLEITQFAGDEVLTLKEFKGTNKYPSVIDWNFTDNPEEMPRSSQDMTVQLSMTDITNKAGDAPLQSVPVRQISLEEQERSGIELKRLLQWEIVCFGGQGELTESGKESVQAAKAVLQKALGQASNNRSPEILLVISDATFRQNALSVVRELGLPESVIRIRAVSSQGTSSQGTSSQNSVIEPSQENKQYRGAVRLEVVY